MIAQPLDRRPQRGVQSDPKSTDSRQKGELSQCLMLTWKAMVMIKTHWNASQWGVKHTAAISKSFSSSRHSARVSWGVTLKSPRPQWRHCTLHGVLAVHLVMCQKNVFRHIWALAGDSMRCTDSFQMKGIDAACHSKSTDAYDFLPCFQIQLLVNVH